MAAALYSIMMEISRQQWHPYYSTQRHHCWATIRRHPCLSQ
jgi:hypothetical protein